MNELACDLWDSPSIAGLFGKTTDEIARHNKLKFFENGLLAYATGLVLQLQVERAREFLQARPEVAEALGPISEWAEMVKQFRDPAAHRLPLVLVSAMLTPADAEKHQELTRMATEAVLAQDLERWSQIVQERETLGRFLPILGSPRGPEGELIAAPNQMAMDQVEFLKGASLLLSRSLDQGYRRAAAV